MFKAFPKVDGLEATTAPSIAFGTGEKTDDPISMYVSDLFTIAVNLAGIPAISIPVGFIQDKPLGMQLIGGFFCEHRLLNIAHRDQKITGWHPCGLQGFEKRG
ncbi:MAG: hypothetical protein L0Y39_10640 [Methylococcaceae bacterium]|nr:hypothetical protein [Methylococcaceae bacterium]